MKLVTLVFASLLSVSAFAAETTTFTPTPVTSETLPTVTNTVTEAVQPPTIPEIAYAVQMMKLEENQTLEVILFTDLADGSALCAQYNLPGSPAMFFSREKNVWILAGCWFASDDGSLIAVAWFSTTAEPIDPPVVMEFAAKDFVSMTCNIELVCTEVTE